MMNNYIKKRIFECMKQMEVKNIYRNEIYDR